MRIVLFDCDGTLVDSQNVIVTAMTVAFGSAGLKPPSRADILSIVGLSLPIAIGRLAAGHGTSIDRLVAAYKTAFHALRQQPEHLEPLFPGTRAVLEALAARDDVLLGVATGKSRRGLDAILATHGLTQFFSVLKTADDAPSKPHPAMVLDAVAELGGDVAATVVVGDTTYDVEMARAAGARAIGVAWGYHRPAQLVAVGADPVIGHFEELVPAFDRLFADAAAR